MLADALPARHLRTVEGRGLQRAVGREASDGVVRPCDRLLHRKPGTPATLSSVLKPPASHRTAAASESPAVRWKRWWTTTAMTMWPETVAMPVTPRRTPMRRGPASSRVRPLVAPGRPPFRPVSGGHDGGRAGTGRGRVPGTWPFKGRRQGTGPTCDAVATLRKFAGPHHRRSDDRGYVPAHGWIASAPE